MKKLEQLKQELRELKESNKSIWEMYGSELCAGDMISKEQKLEEQIKKLENDRTTTKSKY